jgi:Fe2+ or Zn2+ uptake regulation protein
VYAKLNIIKNILKENDLKITRPRIEISKLFLTNDCHLDAEGIYNFVKSKRISLPTVYRTLDVLYKNDIIKKVSIDNIKAYELNLFNEKNYHVHFKCKICKKLFEYDDIELKDNIEFQLSFVESKYHVKADNVSIIMDGLCEECRRKNA